MVQPKKPQPAKSGGGGFAGVTDVSSNAPTPVLPATTQKKIAKVVAPKQGGSAVASALAAALGIHPAAQTSAAAGGGGGLVSSLGLPGLGGQTQPPPDPNSLQGFLDSLGLGASSQPSPQDIQAQVNAYIAPIVAAYNQQLAQLNQQYQGMSTFDQSSAQQLGQWLSQIGGGVYTPDVAALLANQATQNNTYQLSQAQQQLYNDTYGGSNGLTAQLPQIEKQIESQYQTDPSTMLQAISTWNSLNNTQFNQTQTEQKNASAAAAQRAALWKAYEGSVVTDPQTAAILGVKVGTKIPLNSSVTTKAKLTAAKAKQPNATLSAKYGYIVDSNGRPVLDANGKKILVAKTKNPAEGSVSPSLSAQVGIAVDSHGNPILRNGKTIPWKASKTAAGTKASVTAQQKASPIAMRVLAAAAKPVKVKAASANPLLSGSKTTTKTVKPMIGSAAYNQAVNQAIVAVEPYLSPFYSHDEIVRFVQARANQIFAPRKKR